MTRNPYSLHFFLPNPLPLISLHPHLGLITSHFPSGKTPRLTFDALIIVEAAQATEPSTLVPLSMLSEHARVVLVGDQQQVAADRAVTGSATGGTGSIFIHATAQRGPIVHLASDGAVPYASGYTLIPFVLLLPW